MSKSKKKTRKQKVLADLHRKLQSLRTQDIIVAEKKKDTKSQELPKIKIANILISKPAQSPQINPLANTYPYLIKDISKTGILTLAILVAQLITFFLLKIQMLKLPGITY